MTSSVSSVSSLRDLFLLHPDVVFLNHGSFGACPARCLRLISSGSWSWSGSRSSSWGGALPVCCRGSGGPGRLVGCSSRRSGLRAQCDHRLNIVARSLPLAAGDEVLGTDHEYGALDRTWRFVCAKRGARYINQRVPLPVRSAEEVVEAIWAGVTPRTRVLYLSHLSSPTALIFPVEVLIRRAREAGLITSWMAHTCRGSLRSTWRGWASTFTAGTATSGWARPRARRFCTPAGRCSPWWSRWS